MPGASFVLDDFNRANQGPPPSSSWTDSPGGATGSGNMAVVSNALTQFDAAGSFRSGCYWNVQDFGPDTEVGFKVAAWVNTNGNGFALMARLVNVGAGTSDGYVMFIDRGPTTTDWYFQRVDNAAGTTLGSGVNQALVTGDYVAFTIQGSTLTGWFSPLGGAWAQVITATDATYSAAGKVGVQVTNNQEPRIDDFWAHTSRGSLALLGIG